MKLLKKGFAVILPDPFAADTWYFREATSTDVLPDQGNCCGATQGGVTCDSTGSPPSSDDQCQANYWPGPDKAFLGTLFDEIANGTIGSGTLDLGKVSMTGYSVGGQMVSRLFNEAAATDATWTPGGNPFPGIVSGMLLSAGSYYCYASQSPEIPGGGGADSCPSPDLGVTELEYWQPPYPPAYTGAEPEPAVDWGGHPATMLAQLRDDNNANENASTWYYDVLSSRAPDGLAELCRVRASEEFGQTCLQVTLESGQSFVVRHAFFPEAVDPTVEFILRAHGG